jgi:hypothetical protein
LKDGPDVNPLESFMTMRQRFLGACLLLTSAIVLPALPAAPGDKKKAKNAPLDSATLKAGEFTGKLKAVPGSDRLFLVTVETKVAIPKGGANPALAAIQRTQNQIAQAQAQLARAKKPADYNRAAARLQQLQAQLINQTAQANLRAAANVKVKTVRNDVEFQHRDEVKVRTLVLPEQFDDKGNVKKYTKEQLNELKGKDKNLPGYESALEKLEPGQVVTVTLASYRKPKPKPDDKAKPEAKDKDLDKDADTAKADDEKKMQVKLIVIKEEADSSPGEKKGRKR